MEWSSAWETRNTRAARFWLLVMLVALLAMLVVPAIASAAVSSVGTGATTFASNAQLSLAVPSGAVGDLLLAQVNYRATATVSNITPAAGWTLLVNTTTATAADGQAIYYKWATATSESNFTWDYTLSTGTRRSGGAVVRYRGVDSAAAPVVTSNRGTTSSSAVTASGLTTTKANTWIATFMGYYGTTTIANPSGMTSRYAAHATSRGPSVSAADQLIAAAGATGNKASTTSVANWIANMVALVPDTTAPTVMSIAPTTTPTNAASMTFTITFSEPVNGVASGNLSLTTSGVSGASIGTISGSGATRTVTVNTGSGDGTIRLNLASTTPAITDLAGNALTATFNSGALLTVDKSSAVASVTTPADGGAYGPATPLASFSGTAADSAGGVGLAVDSTTFTLQRSLDSKYWTGSTWAGSTNLPTTHDASTSNTPVGWTNSGALPTWNSSDGTYTVQATVTDKLGNTRPGAAVSFKYYGTVPAVTAHDVTATATGITTPVSLDATALDAFGQGVTVTYSIGSDPITPGYAFDLGVTHVTAAATDAAGNTASQPFTVTVDKREITITAVPDDKVYDGTTSSDKTPELTSGTLAPDDEASYSQTFDTKNVGDGKVIAPHVTFTAPASSDYYSITFEPVDTGSITKAALDISAKGDSKTYDGTTSSGETPDVSGLQGDDTVTDLAQAYESTNVLGEGNSVLGVTSYTVNDGNDGQNYDVTTHTHSGTITPATLTVSAKDATKTYGDDDPALTWKLSGLKHGDTADVVTGDPVLERASGEDVGSYAISVADVSGMSAGNYAIVAGGTPGAFTITPATLDISAVEGTKAYDGTTSSGAVPAVTGLKGTDTVSELAQAYQSRHVLGTDGSTLEVASYVVHDGNGGHNYDVSTHTHAGTITPAPLVVTATSDTTKVYDGKRDSAETPTITTGSLLGSDAATFSQSFDTKDAGAGKTITPAVVGFTHGSADDYAITLTAVDTGAIVPAPLTVTATGHDKVYDGTTAALVTLHSGNVVSGDTVTAQYTGAEFADKNVGTAKAVTASGISIGGTDAGNYHLTSMTATAAADITAKPLTVTANDQTKQSGQAFSFTGHEFTVSGLVSGDTIDTVTLSSAGADAAAAAGTYPIVPSAAAGTGLANYNVTYVNGTMTVGAAPVVTYKFSAFAKPLRAKDAKKFHLGDKVLVKFTITDHKGSLVTTLHPRVQVTAKGFKYGPKTVKYNVKKKAYTFSLKIGKSWKLRGYNLTTTLAGSTAKGKVKFKVVK